MRKRRGQEAIVSGKREARLGQSRCRGQALVEFTVAMPFLILMTVGTFVTGMILERYLVAVQLVRNAGSMYVRGIDFSSDLNKQVLLRSASGLNMTIAGGDGVVYLSLVLMAPPDSGNNENLPVVVQRFAIGNPAVTASKVGSPPVDPNGSVPDFFNDAEARATLPANLVAMMVPNQRIFVSEVAHQPNDLSFGNIIDIDNMYSRAFF